MKYFIGIGLIILLIVGVEVVLVSQHANDDQDRVSITDFDRFASLVVENYAGEEIPLEQFRGKSLVINSWAVWCPFCRNELPDFAALQKEFGDDIVVIAIDRQEPLLKVRSYTDELGITDDMHFFLDDSDAFYKTIGGFSMPETLFMNKAGEIVVHKRGPMELAEMREHVETVIRSNENSL